MKLKRFEKILLLLDFAKELAQKFWQKICGSTILKASACLFIATIISVIIFSYKPHAQSLPSCSTLGINITPNAGVNCLYFGLPLCNTVQTPQHRVNCADIIDLPLCSDIVIGPGVSQQPGKNCVNLCSGPAYGSPNPNNLDLVRSVDYAIHNVECIRFCDDVEADVVSVPGSNCSQRKCHQVANQVIPSNGVNCNLLPCNLLTPDELNKSKFDDNETKKNKYCEGDNLKCYELTASQLKYARQRSVNPICIIHTCEPSSPYCGANDVLNIMGRPGRGDEYKQAYITYVNGGVGIESSSYCTHIDCRPVIKSQYRCTSQTADGSNNIYNVGIESSITGTSADIYRNPNCDSTGGGALCGTLASVGDLAYNMVTNYCYKTVDCNKAENSQASECMIAQNLGGNSSSGVDDPFQSWFYRPAPSHKATNSDGILLPMSDSLCYSEGQMIENKWGKFVGFKIGLLDLEFWYHSNWFNSTRSPGACGGWNIGNTGTGYVYVCGTNWLLYNKAAEDAVYFKGYATTDFSGAVPKHKVTVCTRFSNTLQKDACGSRTCGVDAAFDDFTGQACGGDSCEELTIEENDPTKCLMTSGSSMSGGCVAQLDSSGLVGGYLRVRAVKYDDKICGFFDVKGQFAYDRMFFDGSRTITFTEDDQIHPTTVCVNDTSSTDGSCRGYDSNSNKGSASEWRNMLQVHYVDNNRPTGLQGYLDKAGKFYKAQTCPKVTMRIPPPDQYNIATISNSEKLFSPPVTIVAVSKIRDGEDAVRSSGEVYGKTDFHYPQIKVRFGIEFYRMGLGFGYTGGAEDANVENHLSSPSSLTIKTKLGGKDYEARLFVKKEFFENNPIPQFCLYRKIKDQNGVDVAPLNIGCVARNAPDIDNSRSRAIDPSLMVRKVRIVPKSDNEYNNAEIKISYLSGGANKLDNGCSLDDTCTAEISLSNPSYKTPVCVQNIEKHKLCVQREECSGIYVECIKNEIDINNAINNNEPLARFLSIRKDCNETLVPKCNRKKGIIAYGGDIYNQIPSGANVLANAYGWFNEICVVSGFETKLRNILAHNIAGGIRGKCVIDLTSPYLTDNNPATNCNAGGRAPNCICAEAPAEYVSSASIAIRLETSHEAGLCIDMPLPTFCPAIDYTPVSNSDAADTEYVKYSLGNSSYSNNLYSNNFGGVHLTHQDRTGGAISGYAEFVRALPGMNDVSGECKGFWTYAINSSGIASFPLQSCLNNGGVAVWDKNVRNQCVRFSCPNVLTAGPDSDGIYQGGYGAKESGEGKGESNGFAIWQKYTKTNDFLETRSAQACIPGFKPIGSSAITNSISTLITSYSGGTLPSRQCNQLGTWSLSPVNACVRIYCAATNLANPTSSADTNSWAKWYANGGASFPKTYASRSTVRTQPESVSIGQCNSALGFFQAGTPPTRECDYLGNWKPVKNPCTTSCNAITSDDEASSLNNGFAKWNLVTQEWNAASQEWNVINKKVTVYEHCGDPGWSHDYLVGEYADASRSSQASAITLTKGIKATLYEEVNYTGRSVVFTSGNSCFVSVNFNDKLHSLKIEDYIEPNSGVTFAGAFTGCVAGYVTNPYPPITDSRGAPLAASVANDLTRAAQDPKRLCNLAGTSSTSVWGAVSNGCINRCPGVDPVSGVNLDPRIGVGITTHPFRSAGAAANYTKQVSWPSTELGQYAYATNWEGLETLFNAAQFAGPSKTNRYYLLRRFCNNNGKWSNPEAMCSANDGQIGYAKYNKNADPGYPNSLVAGSEATVAGVCLNQNYWYSNRNQDPAPRKQCLFADANKYIDRVYLDFANGTKDCEEKSCGFYPGMIGLRGRIPATIRVAGDDRFKAGSGQIMGTCLNNTTNSAGTWVYTSLASGATLPHTDCKADGTWTAPDDSGCKYGCDVPARGASTNLSGCGDGIDYWISTFTLAHGQSVYISSCDYCGNWNGGFIMSDTCNDGTLLQRNDWQAGWHSCPIDTGGLEGPSYKHGGAVNGLNVNGNIIGCCPDYFDRTLGTKMNKYNQPVFISGWVDDDG